MAATEQDFDDRLGPGITAIRRRKERRLWSSKKRRTVAWWHPARYVPMRRLVPLGLRVLGLWDLAHTQCLAVRVVENEVRLSRLPAAFDGYRILQITDLHTDIDPALTAAVIAAIQSTHFDRAVVTGDYHNEIGGDWDRSLELHHFPHSPPWPGSARHPR